MTVGLLYVHIMLCNRNIEDILAEKGETVKKLKYGDHDDSIEVTVEDLIGEIDMIPEKS